MSISAQEAERLHRLAQAAGIDDSTIEDWTAELGGYRYAITGHRNGLKAGPAAELRQRIQNHVAQREQAVLAAAAEAAGITPPPAPGTPMITERQVDYILSLLDQRTRSGEGGGFYTGPTDKAGIQGLTRHEASLYIKSLKGDY